MPADIKETVTELIREATHIVALTGAGISTAAGIPEWLRIDEPADAFFARVASALGLATAGE